MRIIILLISSVISISLYCQNGSDEIKATNFSVPSSIAFDLLDASPSEVHKPGLTKDFKLDWVLNDNQLNPNIAIEAQPIWLFFNKNKSLSEYKDKKNKLGRFLSSLNFSLGTTSKDSLKSLAYGVTLNLFTQKDPLLDDSLISHYENTTDITVLDTEKDKLLLDLDAETDEAKKAIIKKKILLLDKQIADDKEKKEKILKNEIEKWEKANWNSTVVDIGFGEVFDYKSNDLDSLNLSQKGFALWLAGTFGVGKSIMVNGMIKYSNFESDKAFEIGGNIRYGSKRANGFIEFLHNSKEDSEKYNISYGIDYQMANNLVIQASLKTRYDSDFDLKDLIPSIDFNYQLSQ